MTPREQLTEATALAKFAHACLTTGDFERAAWRLADAGLLLRRGLEGMAIQNPIGLDEPTGRGAVLPTSTERGA